jgi:uncharacterized RDD family membrane protein YckC
MGLKVVTTDGSPLSWGRALLRYIGYIISAAAFSLGFLWLAYDPKRQGWHDKIARTVVIDSDDIFNRAGPVQFVPSDPRPSWIWLIIWIVLALTVPGALLTSLWVLGPVLSRYLIQFYSGQP